jgi:hypothetical protein
MYTPNTWVNTASFVYLALISSVLRTQVRVLPRRLLKAPQFGELALEIRPFSWPQTPGDRDMGSENKKVSAPSPFF